MPNNDNDTSSSNSEWKERRRGYNLNAAIGVGVFFALGIIIFGIWLIITTGCFNFMCVTMQFPSRP